MTAISSPYVLLMITAALICLSIAVYVWPHRENNSETVPLVLLLLGITEWIVAALLGLVDQNLSHKILWAKFEYIGVVSVPLMVLGYVVYHSGSMQYLTKRRIAWLVVIPVVTLILAWSNGSHGLIWAKYVPYQENGLVFSEKTYGPAFWVYWIYSYLILLTATVLTFRQTVISAKIFRWQSFLVMVGILAPWIGNFLYVLHIDPLKNFDLTPLAFSITGIMLAVGMFRWRLFDIKPIAHKAVIAGMADGVMILDNLGRIVEVNPAAQRILELDAGKIIGKEMDEIIAHRLPPGEEPFRMKGTPIHIRLTSGAENRDYELSDSSFYEKRDTTGGRIVFMHDVTERKRLEENLKEAERKQAELLLQQAENKYETLYQNMTVGVIYQNADGSVVDMNPAAERILGVNLTQHNDLSANRNHPKSIHEDGSDYPAEEHPSMVSLKTNQPLRNQVMGVYNYNELAYRWININTVLRYKPGEDKPDQVFITFEDITERKRAEEALIESYRLLQTIINTTPLRIFWKDKESRYLGCNPAFAIDAGMTGPQDLIDKDDYQLVWNAQAELYRADDQQVMRSGIPKISYDEPQFTPDGNLIWLRTSKVPLRNKEKQIIGLLGVYEDITVHKQAEREIQERNEDLLLINILNDAANRGENIEGIIDVFAREAGKVFDCQAVTLYLLSPDRTYIEMVSTTLTQNLTGRIAELFGGPVPKIRILLEGNRFLSEALANEQGTISNDPKVIQQWIEVFSETTVNPPELSKAIQAIAPQIHATLDNHSMITLPLTSTGQTIGLLNLASQKEFNEEDLRRMQTISQQMTVAIKRKQAEELVQLQLQRMRALSEIDQAINSSLNMHLSLDILLSKVISQLGVDASSVLLVNPSHHSLEYVAGKGFRSAAIRQSEMSLEEEPVKQVVISQKIVHLSDFRASGSQFQRVDLLKGEEFVEYFGVPLVAKEELKGILEIFHRAPLYPDQEWMAYLMTLGGQAAIAIDNTLLFEGMQRSNQELISAYDATIEGWSHAMDLRDKETEGHSQRVTELTLKLANIIGINQKELVNIRRGALLHDIGKLGIPDRILLKPGPLTEDEWTLMRKHPQFSYDMLSPITYLKPAIDIPYCHHEKWDGTGYPRGLKEEEIPLAARLFAVVDVWDALRSVRPYRDPWPDEKVLAHIKAGSGTHFDPKVVDLFLRLMSEKKW